VRRAPATTRALAAPIPLDAPVTTAIRSPAMARLLSALGRVVLDPAPTPGLDRGRLLYRAGMARQASPAAARSRQNPG
jgi:hypothetical protein